MNKSAFILCIVMAAITAFAVTRLAAPVSRATGTSSGETAFDRITKTNTLRCGYAVATPWFMVDPNTKTMSGVAYDMTNAVADKMHVKVEWVEETGWGVAEQGLTNKRYDMMCGNVCVDPNRARAATFSMPFTHAPMLAVVRSKDTKFAHATLEDLNKPDVRIAVKNGHIFEYIANERFPKAKKVYLGDISDDTEFLLMVAMNKADFTFSGQETVNLYDKQHPGEIQTIAEPARYCNGAFMVPLGDFRLKAMVDNAITEINSSGGIAKIVEKYMPLDPRYIGLPAQQYDTTKP